MSFFEKARIEILSEKILSDGWTRLRELTIRYTGSAGRAEILRREIYDRGEAATILLFDPARQSVILVRQFRITAFEDGQSGFLLETPAGMLDADNPADAIRREVMEETGYEIGTVEPLFEAYMSPGAVREYVHFFFARIEATRRTGKGGGLEEEAEDIEVLEVPLAEALAMIKTGEIKDGKTILLLHWAGMNKDMLMS